MEYRPLGGSGLLVSELTLGAMMLGPWGNPDQRDCERIVAAAVDGGVNLIDTADAYSQGESERIVGRAVRDLPDVLVATKLNAQMGDGRNRSGQARRWVVAACEDSLRRLGRDHIDLYQLHRPDRTTALEETLEALSELVVAGKVRAVGASNTPAERIVEATDDLLIDLNGRRIRVADTPGHARHHVCYFDETTRAWFTGDTFGLSYRELDRDGRASIFPSTTPVQFDPDALHASIDRLMAADPSAIYVTHYSRITALKRLAADLHRLIDAHVAIARAGAGAIDRRHQIIRAGLTALLLEESARQRWPLDEAALLELFEVDLDLNAQGLEVWLDAQ